MTFANHQTTFGACLAYYDFTNAAVAIPTDTYFQALDARLMRRDNRDKQRLFVSCELSLPNKYLTS